VRAVAASGAQAPAPMPHPCARRRLPSNQCVPFQSFVKSSPWGAYEPDGAFENAIVVRSPSYGDTRCGAARARRERWRNSRSIAFVHREMEASYASAASPRRPSRSSRSARTA
jgi:hypothetical protein